MTEHPEITEISTTLANRVMEELGQNVYLCYQCLKCTSGCPVAEFFDWQPHQVMRALQFGDEEIALNSTTPWLCAACQTCTTRCPQNLDINAIMEFLTREATARGIKPQVPVVDIFSKAFMNEVRLWGRAYELGLMAEMKLRTGDLFSDLDLGAKMIQHRKISLVPHPARAPKAPKRIEKTEKTVGYYPGCSLHSTAPEFDLSTKDVCEALGLDLVEPKGWVCCGSSAAHKKDPEEALRLPMENLRIIEQSGLDEVTMPCAACFNRHKAAQYEFRHDRGKREQVTEQIDYHYQDSVAVNTLYETLIERVGLEGISQHVKKPLKGLKVVCYYGCLLTRPPEVTEAAHPENPTEMDKLMKALGAEVLDWSYKTTCCGAAHSLTRPDIVLSLSSEILNHAKHTGADVIAVACPLCHTNLDGRQFQMQLESPVPVLFFTQLMAIALDLPVKSAALNKNLIDPRPILREKNLIDQ
jgi:heterodisulfide reductase subunit B